MNASTDGYARISAPVNMSPRRTRSPAAASTSDSMMAIQGVIGGKYT